MARASKAKTVYVCAACGEDAPRWMGRCPVCQAWNSLTEHRLAAAPSRGGLAKAAPAARATPLAQVDSVDAQRLPTGIAELDRALGGGVVPGGVVLLGGDPGIGKSTLLMQALASVCAGGRRALYATGEESASQVALRGERLGGPGMREVLVLATTDLADVEAAIDEARPDLVVIDSIQTLRAPELESAAGTVSQLREVAARLVERAKRGGIAVFLIGHVTKDGAIAGPKVLEHVVDTVLAFEGDASGAFRLVRATKNRFGPAHELGIFEMAAEGLRGVENPSALFLAERPVGASGSIVVPTAEGSRPLLVEVQALVAPATYGAARRVSSGVDPSRLAILLAVLERRADVQIADRDVFASVAGGARVDERAVDLALALAIVSSLRDRPLPADLVVFGELGLAGEVRAVPRAALRLAEARKMGFARAVLPRGSAERLDAAQADALALAPVRTLDEALAHVFG